MGVRGLLERKIRTRLENAPVLSAREQWGSWNPERKSPQMFDIKRKTLEWGGRKLTLETGRIARQADGAVLATYGETVVLATVVAAKTPKAGIDFFPLMVNYQEKTFAAGKIPGGFFKREGRPSEKETLVSRLIDRPIRPLFVKGFKNEVQVVVTVLAHDMENDPDIVAMIAASAALTISGAPFMGPIGGARVGFIDGQYVLNPTGDQVKSADNRMDLVVAGTADAVMMVESEIKELAEDVVLGGVSFAHKAMQAVIDAIVELADHVRPKDPVDFQPTDDSAMIEAINGLVGADIRAAFKITDKVGRQRALADCKIKVMAHLGKNDARTDGFDLIKLGSAFKDAEAHVLRRDIIENGHRVDGRDVKTVPRHRIGSRYPSSRPRLRTIHPRRDPGSGGGDAGNRRRRTVHRRAGRHLQGEVPPALQLPLPIAWARRAVWAPPGRREIGHGKLAWRALRPMLPTVEEFPLHHPPCVRDHRVEWLLLHGHRLRVVAGDDGCGRALKKPVAGVAMGLILEPSGEFAILTRHPRRRRSSRRHGLQGRGDRRWRHLAADGY